MWLEYCSNMVTAFEQCYNSKAIMPGRIEWAEEGNKVIFGFNFLFTITQLHMKKKFISLLFIPFGLIPLASLGQISSGTTLLGGTLNYNSYNTRVNSTQNQVFKNNSFAIAPKAGYFISDNLVLGASLGLTTGKQKNGSDIQSKHSGYSIGPFVRYYKFLSERLAIFGNAAFNYNKTKTNSLNFNQELVHSSNNEIIGAYLTPGLTYFASSRIGLEISLGYIGYYKNLNEQNVNTTNYYKNNNSGFVKYYGLGNSALGVNFYLGR